MARLDGKPSNSRIAGLDITYAQRTSSPADALIALGDAGMLDDAGARFWSAPEPRPRGRRQSPAPRLSLGPRAGRRRPASQPGGR